MGYSTAVHRLSQIGASSSHMLTWTTFLLVLASHAHSVVSTKPSLACVFETSLSSSKDVSLADLFHTFVTLVTHGSYKTAPGPCAHIPLTLIQG